MSADPLVSLRLALPQALEEQVIDQLLEHPEGVGAFSTWAVDGHGSPNSIASSAEQVRGRAGRVQFEILIGEAQAHALVAHLKAALPTGEIAWWMTPVLAAGDLA